MRRNAAIHHLHCFAGTTEISMFDTIKSSHNTVNSGFVFQAVQPAVKNICFFNFVFHAFIVSFVGQKIKLNF
ncbi:MAG: hypothetical protein D3923_03215 [Candidatus Electrothrix sp. AR3]|nr:hypothetical protein [Candidatus Electrothrix sp. AR3]